MGGKGSGRKATHNDLYHKLVREHQRKYDQEIARIARKNKCSLPEARKIRGDKRRRKKQ